MPPPTFSKIQVAPHLVPLCGISFQSSGVWLIDYFSGRTMGLVGFEVFNCASHHRVNVPSIMLSWQNTVLISPGVYRICNLSMMCLLLLLTINQVCTLICKNHQFLYLKALTGLCPWSSLGHFRDPDPLTWGLGDGSAPLGGAQYLVCDRIAATARWRRSCFWSRQNATVFARTHSWRRTASPLGRNKSL